MRLKLTLRVQNDEMLAARARLGLTQRTLSELSGVSQPDICRLEKLDYTVHDGLQKATRIAGVLELSVESVLPRDAVGLRLPTTQERFLEGNVRNLLAAENVRAALPSPAEAVANAEIKDVIRTVLKRLNEKERIVLKMRFGVGGERQHTLNEVARQLKVTRERVRQLEARAILKLGHPNAAKLLSQFISCGRPA